MNNQNNNQNQRIDRQNYEGQKYRDDNSDITDGVSARLADTNYGRNQVKDKNAFFANINSVNNYRYQDNLNLNSQSQQMDMRSSQESYQKVCCNAILINLTYVYLTFKIIFILIYYHI